MILQDTQKEPGGIHLDRDRISLDLDNICELFIAPDFDPLSKKETEYMGQAAMNRIINQLEPGWSRHARNLRLTIRLPPDQITPGLPDQVKEAVFRFCWTKIYDNDVRIRNLHWNGLRGVTPRFCISRNLPQPWIILWKRCDRGYAGMAEYNPERGNDHNRLGIPYHPGPNTSFRSPPDYERG